MKEKLSALIKSRRFWAAVTGVAVICLEELAGLSNDQALAITGVLMAWIIGDSIKKT